MSTIRTDTLSNAAGSKSVPVNTVVDGSAKAWVNFNGTGTVAIRAAFNVTSITDNGVGKYTLNFTAAMADANFSMVATAKSEHDNTGFALQVVSQYQSQTLTTTSASLQVKNHTSDADSSAVYVAIFR